jgi:lipopolysaccharide transport system ATP-binding protein
LELGAGFHPDLTGRENIYLNGSILGLSRKEIRRKFDSIVSFAEIERFIDVPVKHYSSGMYVRLGFSVAIHIDPEILLIDEVLAVGDAAFQKKCLEKVKEMKGKGVTILLVSHDMNAVRNLCNRAIWLDYGMVRADGGPEEVVSRYLEGITACEKSGFKLARGRRWGSGEVEIIDVRFLDSEGKERCVFATGERMMVRMRYLAHTEVKQPVFGLAIYRDDGLHINGPNTKLAGYPIEYIEGEGEVYYEIEQLPLLKGTYYLSVAVYDCECIHAYDHHDRTYTFKVQPGAVKEVYGSIYIPSRWSHVVGSKNV